MNGKPEVKGTWIEHDESVGPDEVEAAASSLARQHEDEVVTSWVVETLEHVNKGQILARKQQHLSWMKTAVLFLIKKLF